MGLISELVRFTSAPAHGLTEHTTRPSAPAHGLTEHAIGADAIDGEGSRCTPTAIQAMDALRGRLVVETKGITADACRAARPRSGEEPQVVCMAQDVHESNPTPGNTGCVYGSGCSGENPNAGESEIKSQSNLPSAVAETGCFTLR